jgi:hypothetical protein
MKMGRKRKIKEEEIIEEEIIEGEEEKPKIELEFDEYGMVKYEFRYVLGLSKEDNPNCYVHYKESNTLKDLKTEAEKVFQKFNRSVQVWDRHKWTDSSVLQLDPEPIPVEEEKEEEKPKRRRKRKDSNVVKRKR